MMRDTQGEGDRGGMVEREVAMVVDIEPTRSQIMSEIHLNGPSMT